MIDKHLGTHDVHLKISDFIAPHRRSYKWFFDVGLQRLFDSIMPVKDGLGRMWSLEVEGYRLGEAVRTPEEALSHDLTYDAPLFVTFKLTNLRTGEIKTQEIHFTNFPLLTNNGYFIVSGVMRVVQHQIVRAEGVLFLNAKAAHTSTVIPGVNEYIAKVMPERGIAYTFDINKMGVITVRLVGQRMKILVTELLKAINGYSNEEILKKFADVDTGNIKYIQATLDKDNTKNRDEAVMDMYNKLRPGEVVTLDRATRYIRGFFFNSRRFYLGNVGRYQLNQKFDSKYERPVLVEKDLVDIVKHLIKVNNGEIKSDDQDSMQNRRLRSVGESLYRSLQSTLVILERNIKDRMSRLGSDQSITPAMLVNSKVVTGEINAFFGMSALSKFMQQENVFSALQELNLITAKGPGGLTVRSAVYSVRDLHPSHYGRLCPFDTPEGPSIGLNLHLAMYAHINEFGFIEAPYRRLINEVKNKKESLINRVLRKALTIQGKEYASGIMIDNKLASLIVKEVKEKTIKVNPFVEGSIDYIDYYHEQGKNMGGADVSLDKYDNIESAMVMVRKDGEFKMTLSENLNYMDVSPQQVQGVAISMVPFVSSNDGKRVNMAAKMQTQAVPLLYPEVSLVSTGTEREIAQQTQWLIESPLEGKVTQIDGQSVTVTGTGKDKGKKFTKKITTFASTNKKTSIIQKAVANLGDKVSVGDLLVDGPSMKDGMMALGKNIRIAIMSFDGHNYNDSCVVSDRIIRKDIFTSVHIKMYTQDLRETKLGPEVLTRDIPGVSEKLLRNLDIQGVIRSGAVVNGGDILAGVVAAKAAKQLSAEERLLMAVFGESAREVQNNSLRMPYGSKGIIMKTTVLSEGDGQKLPPAVIRRVKVWVAQLKKASYGDKFVGFYGDKMTIGKVVPEADMPFTADGEPVDMIITPLFIKRMNIGQSKEMFYASLAKKLGHRLIMPNFEKLDEKWLATKIKEVDANKEKVTLYDGRTGQAYDKKVAVGWRYMFRLGHIAAEKMHARSTGPYSAVTQQPLGGKQHQGGQRLGEMETRTLQSHGAAHVLREMLTIKSDDSLGRTDAYRAIIQGEPITSTNIPASFNVLLKELNSLGVKVNLMYDTKPVVATVDSSEDGDTEDGDTEDEKVEKTDEINVEKTTKDSE